MEKVSTKKVLGFLNGLSEIDFVYLKTTVDIAANIKSLIRTYKIDKKKFCELMEIKPADYKKFVSGSQNYDLEDLAKIKIAWINYNMEEAAKNGIIEYEKK